MAKQRLPSSLVWNFFTYDKGLDVSLCQVLVDKEEGKEPCNHKIKGKYPTNLKLHLKSHHKNEFSTLTEQEDKEKKKMEQKKLDSIASSFTKSRQLKLSELKSDMTYDKSSRKYKAITKKLAVFIGTSNVATSLVDNLEFRELLLELDKQYNPPGRKGLSKEIEGIAYELKAKINSVLQSASRINLCADIWTKKGMTASFLGITAHCFSQADHKRHSVTLAVEPFPSPHTAIRIAQTFNNVLHQWNIPKTKVFRILTDNGSNMVAFVKPHCTDQLDNDDSDDGEGDILNTLPSQESMESHSSSDSNHSDDDLESRTIAAIEESVTDFEVVEEIHQTTLTAENFKRLGCFIHTLQLVVNSCVISSNTAVKKARQLVSRCNKSYKTTEKLVKKAGKKLINDVPTRWNSTFLMISRMIDVKPHLVEVLEEQEWESLSSSEWKRLQAIEKILEPFHHHTNITSAEDSTTIAMVIPVLKELELHLGEMKKPGSTVTVMADKMLTDMKKRFKFVTDAESDMFDPVYITSTYFNPAYKNVLSKQQEELAQVFIKQLISHQDQYEVPAETQTEGNPTIDPIPSCSESGEPQAKRFKHLSRLSKLLEVEEEQSRENRTPDKHDLELNEYSLASTTIEERKMDPLDYWVGKLKHFPVLAPIACDILAVPASTAPVERIFSTGGDATGGKRNRLTQKNLEREIFIRRNKKYL